MGRDRARSAAGIVGRGAGDSVSVSSDATGALVLEGARIQLRPFAPAFILALIDGDDTFAEQFGAPAAEGLRDFFVSGEVSPIWLEQLRNAIDVDPWLHGFAVVDRASNTAIGTAGFKGAPDKDGVVEIAYGIVPSFEGRGIATEAAGVLVAFASSDPRVRIVRAHTLPEDNASTRVLKKNDFAFAGAFIDPEDGPVWRWERAKESCAE